MVEVLLLTRGNCETGQLIKLILGVLTDK